MKVIIAGGGIGGLTAALFLHKAGVACKVYEKVLEIQHLGVGITLLPHAVKALDEIGLMEPLDRLGVRTDRMIFRTRGGQAVWDAPRGLKAGDRVEFTLRPDGTVQLGPVSATAPVEPGAEKAPGSGLLGLVGSLRCYGPLPPREEVQRRIAEEILRKGRS